MKAPNYSVCVTCMKDVLKGWTWKRNGEKQDIRAVIMFEYIACPKGIAIEEPNACHQVPEKCPFYKEHTNAISMEPIL